MRSIVLRITARHRGRRLMCSNGARGVAVSSVPPCLCARIPPSERWPKDTLHLHRLAQLLAELNPRPMQPAPHGTDGNIQNRSDPLVIALLHLAQYEDRAVLFAQAAQG